MANFTPGFADKVDESNTDYRYGVSFTFPDGVMRYSDVALDSRLGGEHEPYVLDWGEISDAAGDRSNATQISDWVTLKIADPEDDWVRRGNNYELRGTPVSLVYGVVGLDTADYFTRTFILLDWKVADGVITIQCGPSFLLQLLAPFPDVRLDLASFPDLPDEAIGLYAPVGPYGLHDGWSFGRVAKGSSDGAIIPIYVGERTETNLLSNVVSGSEYIFGLGRIKGVRLVFEDSIPITPGFATGNWQDQALYRVVNGITWSRIMFQSNKSQNEIAADVEGYETIGDGTGDLIAGMAEQIEHFLTNFGFGRYKTGLWLSATAHLDMTYQAAVMAYLSSRIPNGYVGGRYIEATQDRGLVLDEIDSWCASAEVKPVITVGGKIGFGADTSDDHGDADVLPLLAWQESEINTGQMVPTFPSTDAAKRIIGESGYSQARGDYGERLGILSPTAQEDSADKVSRSWAPCVITTVDAAEISGFFLWLKAQNMRDLMDGDPVTRWEDESGSRLDWHQPVPANAPTYALDSQHGFPAIEFNGVDQWLEGPDGDDFIDGAHWGIMISLLVTDTMTEQTIFSAGSARIWIFNGFVRATNGSDSVLGAITEGWHTVAGMFFGLQVCVFVDNSVPEQKTGSSNASPFALSFLGAGSGGSDPFAGKIGELTCHAFGHQQQSWAKLYAHQMRNWTTRGDTTEQERDASSRRGVANERSRMFVTMDTPLWPLNHDLLEPFAMIHPGLPYPKEVLDRFGRPADMGSQNKKWAKRVLNLMERVEDVGQHTLSLGLADRTGVSHLARYSGIAEFTHDQRREGIAVSGLGVRRIFTHMTPIYVKSPAGQVEQVLAGRNYGLPDGELQDPAAKPLLLRTSFTSQLTGITVTGGAGSITAVNIVDDGVVPLFGFARDQTGVTGFPKFLITEYLARFEAGNPHNADRIATWPVSVDHTAGIATSSVETGATTVITTETQHGLRTGDVVTISGHTGSTPSLNGSHTVTVTGLYTFSLAVDVTVAGTGGILTRLLQAGDALCLSVDIKGDGGPLHFEAINEDGDFWDNTNLAWSATPVLNPLPLGSADEITRVRSEPIIWAGTTGNATVNLQFPNGEVVDGGIVDVYHVGLEDNPFPSSRMPQDDTYTGLRPQPLLSWLESDSKGTYAFNEPCFTIAGRFTCPWNADDLNVQTPAGFQAYFWKVCYEQPPDNNYWAGGFNGSDAAQEWFLEMRNDTNEDTAVEATQLPVRGVEIAVVWRLVGADGEWGYTPHTMIVSANGVHGTPFTLENIRPVPIPNARIEFGLHGAFVKDMRFDYRVWSDEEVYAWSVQ